MEEVPREPGIRAVSSFFGNFGGEDVVVRPASPERSPFKIEVLLSSGKAVFPPAAPVHEKDIVERVDPRGGVIEYVISEYEFSKDPFDHGNDHWNATLVEKGRANRPFAQPSIVVHGGTNQIAVGDSNTLQQFNQAITHSKITIALDEIANGIPRDKIPGDQVAAIEDTLSDARQKAEEGAEPGVIKRALYAIRGVLEEISNSAKDGGLDAVKTWSAAAIAIVAKQITGL